MKRLKDEDYKKTLTKLVSLSMTNPEPATELINQMFDDDEFKEQAIKVCEAYMKPEYRDSTLVVKTIDVKALNSLVKICKRDGLGIIPLDFTEDEHSVYENGDKIHVLVLSGQEKDFNLAALEAYSVSGTAAEVFRMYADMFAKDLSDDNPMLEIKDVEEPVYKAMKDQVKKLPSSMQFTMFPKKKDNGKIDVGFFLKTDMMKVKRNSRIESNGPYTIPKIAAVMLACALLDAPEYDKEYEEKKKQNRELMNSIMSFYYESDTPFYAVPATINKDGSVNVFMDKDIYYDFYSEDCPDISELEEQIKENESMNRTLVIMNQLEFQKFRNEISIMPKNLDFFKDRPLPAYMSPEILMNKDISTKLIDTLNHKREEIMLSSDDFNGKNLTNLDNYLYASVNEIIMREDEDFSKFTAENKIENAKEIEVLSTINDKYQLSYVYGGYDKVTELINAERTPELSKDIGTKEIDIDMDLDDLVR